MTTESLMIKTKFFQILDQRFWKLDTVGVWKIMMWNGQKWGFPQTDLSENPGLWIWEDCLCNKEFYPHQRVFSYLPHVEECWHREKTIREIPRLKTYETCLYDQQWSSFNMIICMLYMLHWWAYLGCLKFFLYQSVWINVKVVSSCTNIGYVIKRQHFNSIIPTMQPLTGITIAT